MFVDAKCFVWLIGRCSFRLRGVGDGVSLDRPGVLPCGGVSGLVFCFLTESLILAQDERWRRA